jgi:hypothetical protein
MARPLKARSTQTLDMTMKAKITLAALLGICLLGYQGSARAANDSFLLFQFAMADDNFNTEFYISNTSKDPLGTMVQSGQCDLFFYGENAPSSNVALGTITAGTIYLFSVSAVAPGFYGYVIAACNFPFAHGLALLLANGSYFSSYSPLSIVTPRPNNEENLNN